MGMDDEAEGKLLGSFREFGKLERLSVTSFLLCDSRDTRLWGSHYRYLDIETPDTNYYTANLSDILPASIIELRIRECEIGRIAPKIVELVDNKPLFPNLKTIRLGMGSYGFYGFGHPNAVDAFIPSRAHIKRWVVTEAEAKGWLRSDEEGREKDERWRKWEAERSLVEEMEVACWEEDVSVEMWDITNPP